VSTIPYAGILINALGMQEAKDSSAIENIVTTHNDLFRDAAFPKKRTTRRQRRCSGTFRR